jgi:hypothetical protein
VKGAKVARSKGSRPGARSKEWERRNDAAAKRRLRSRGDVDDDDEEHLADPDDGHDLGSVPLWSDGVPS